MANESTLAELVAASGQMTEAQRDLIKNGRTVWYRGKAAPAEAGLVAVDTESGGRIIIDEKDVRRVEKDGVAFLVEVTADANVLVRFESVVRADQNAGKCSTDESNRSPSSPEGPQGPQGQGSQGYWRQVCNKGEVVWHCKWYVGVNGWPLLICDPRWDSCPGWSLIPTSKSPP